MAGSSANPRVWAGADVYVAPSGTTAPTDIVTAWAGAFIALGLLSDEGVTEARDDDQTQLYAHGGLLVRVVRSKHTRTFTALAIEDNKTVWQAANPGSTVATVSTVTTRTVKVPTALTQAWGYQLTDGTNVKRIAIPSGEVTNVGDRVFADSEMTITSLTISVYADSASVLYKEITNDAQAIVP